MIVPDTLWKAEPIAVIPVKVIRSVGLVKLELSSDCNLKVIVGVDVPATL